MDIVKRSKIETAMSGFWKNQKAESQIIDKSIGVLFIAYIGLMAVQELVNASADLTGVVGTMASIVLPIIAIVAFIQVLRGRN